jgi:type VI secretion system secreted protein VgrG
MATLDLSLASGELSVRRFVVNEAISRLFSVSVWGRSAEANLNLAAILDQPATFRSAPGYLHVAGLGQRTWKGIVTFAEQVHALQPQAGQKGLSTYHVQIVPDLFRLTQRRGNRIFQQLSIPDIVETLLGEWGIEKVWKIERSKYPKLEYKVQYAESDYAFFSRLLEEAGISFTFPEDHGGTLTLGDMPQSGPVRAGETIRYVDHPSQASEQEYVTAVRLSRDVRPGKYVIRDYEFRNPDFGLFGHAKGAHGIEQYHFDQGAFLVESGKGGGTPVADDRGVSRHDEKYGNELAARSLEGERVGIKGVSFEANAFDLAPGSIFSMTWHPHTDLSSDRRLLVLETTFEGTAEGEWSLLGQAVFAEVPYHPPRATPKPIVHGLQCATVVGPKGQEIHTDEFGRVRVQLPWDREGKLDENSSCWLRVNQGWGGMGYGMIMLPRIGQEVLVAFAEGDPDLPFVMGRVYNAMQQVPYRLPEHKTRSTWKSDSSQGSGGFNEIMFEDLAKTELVWQQAEKNRVRIVKNDEFATVGHDRQKLVKKDERNHTDGAHKRFVGKDADYITKQIKRERVDDDHNVEVKGNRSERIDGKQSLTVAEDRHEKVEGSYSLAAGDEAHIVAGEQYIGEAGQSFTVRGPGGFLRFDGDGVTIEGTMVLINISGGPGEGSGSKPEKPEDPKLDYYTEQFRALDERTEDPLVDMPYRIELEDGSYVTGRTDDEGLTTEIQTLKPKGLKVTWGADDIGGEDPGFDEGC